MAGSLLRLKCIEKYNRLLEIEDDRGGTARFADTTVSAGKANVSR
jgi:enolase